MYTHTHTIYVTILHDLQELIARKLQDESCDLNQMTFMTLAIEEYAGRYIQY